MMVRPENLKHIDVGLSDGAKLEIEMAAYVLTNWFIANNGQPAGRREWRKVIGRN